MATLEKDELEVLIGHIPTHCASAAPAQTLECCCGRKDCAYLKHNCTALDDLEREVRTAATLGQVRTFLVLPPLSCLEIECDHVYRLWFEGICEVGLYLVLKPSMN
jgi:hypothetical protein